MLQSIKQLYGDKLGASDGDIGHVEGFLVDDETWAVRYVIVNTSNWWLGHQVLIPPLWINEVRWADSTVSVNLTRASIQSAPPLPSAVRRRG